MHSGSDSDATGHPGWAGRGVGRWIHDVADDGPWQDGQDGEDGKSGHQNEDQDDEGDELAVRGLTKTHSPAPPDPSPVSTSAGDPGSVAGPRGRALPRRSTGRSSSR